MAESLFQKLIRTAKSLGQAKSAARKAGDWFIDRIRKLSNPKYRDFTSGKSRLKQRSSLIAGRMYMFVYDPKHKKTLPYYDKFPLCIPVKPDGKGTGFYGLNLHYLKPGIRAQFLDKLMEVGGLKERNLRDTSRMKITYDLLVSTARLKAFRPCFKHYLKKHMKTKGAEVKADEWTTAIFLPTEQFEKASKQKVWKDSSKLI